MTDVVKRPKEEWIETADLFTMCDGRWLEIFADLAPALKDALEHPGKHGPCPHPSHSSANNVDAFKVYRNVKERGNCICNSCEGLAAGGKGNATGVQTLRWINGWDSTQTMQALDQWVRDKGVVHSPLAAPAPRKAPDPAELRRKGDEVRARFSATLSQAVELSHPSAWPARQYLALRGLDWRHVPDQWRFVARLTFWSEPRPGKFVKRGLYPALVAIFRDQYGNPCTVHRTYLAEDGMGKLVIDGDDQSARKLGIVPPDQQVTGGAIHLFKAGPVLAVTEGIETALSVYQATGLPVWPTFSDGMMASLVLPDVVRSVAIFADYDKSEAGDRAAASLVARYPNRVTQVYLPSMLGMHGKGVDWNDVLRFSGRALFPSRDTLMRDLNPSLAGKVVPMRQRR